MSGVRLMLVRHGQTEANTLGALDSVPPGSPLTELGHEQARALVQRLAGQPVTALYTSTALRTQQTAAPLAQARDLPVTVLGGVHEVQAGDLEGRTDAPAIGEFAQVFHRWTAGELDARMPGAETGSQLRTRYLADVARIRAEHTDGLVVLVSHGGAIRLATQWLVPELSAELAEKGWLANTGHALLEADGAGWRCLEWTGLRM